jgi:protein-disulfide isomerase
MMAHRLLVVKLLLILLSFSAPSATEAQQDRQQLTQKISIQLFSDFQCPFCAQFAPAIRELQKEGIEGAYFEVEFKQFPLNFHPEAQLAALAALAAREQGKFWEMHDLLFANQTALKRNDLLRYAKKVGLDLDRFVTDLDSERLKKTIEADMAEGIKRGVSGTPTFFINGRGYSGAKSFDQLKQLVAYEQRRMLAMSEIADNMMSRGAKDAFVTVEFFADLQSPVTRPAIRMLDELLRRYPSIVRLQFRSFPLAFHPQAGLAHEAAIIAASRGHFWEFVSYILDHQDSLREQDLISYAGRLGLDEVKFAEMIREHRYAVKVEADLEAGLRRGIRGSPVIFVNENRIDGVPSLDKLVEYVESELAVRDKRQGRPSP